MTRTAKTLAALALSLSPTWTTAAADDSPRDLASETWVATDALGRGLPLHKDVGPPRANRFVGAFYFLWLGESGDAGPFDLTKILAKDPAAVGDPKSPLLGPELAPHHWGESVFGYYTSDDESVLRKHAQMLTDAGVDMIVFDVTNQVTYPRSWKALCRVFDRVKREGNRVPQIAFLCPFGEPGKVVRELWDDLYGRNLYPDLWFRWEGKPLILADPALLGSGSEFGRRAFPDELTAGHTLGQTFHADRPFNAVGGACPTWASRGSAVTLTLFAEGPKRERVASRRFENVDDNVWLTIELDAPRAAGTYTLELSDPHGKVGWWGDPEAKAPLGPALADGKPARGDRTLLIRTDGSKDDQIRRFFTFRKPQPDYFQGPTGPGQWGWLEVHPQHAFYQKPGVPEEVAVGVGQNAADGKLSVFTNPRAHGRSFHDGAEPGPAGRDFTGRNFAEQWRRAIEIDPPFVFVTNWNEWIAGRFSPANMPLHGTGPVTFVDEFDAEFSRDVEPAKGAHQDAYLYQMAANIRRYKGARPGPDVEPAPVTVDGRFDDWRPVRPEFLDTVGDPVRRDHRGWGKTLHYQNMTGRNDLVAAKVSVDDRSVSFYARTRDALTAPEGSNWMLLFLDTDHDPKTGWMGYDVVVNRKREGGTPGTATLERNVGGRYEWGTPENVPARFAGNELELSIPRASLGVASPPTVIDFKWSDNVQGTGDWSDFTLNGDSAPNDRYNYRATLRKTK